LTHLPLSSLRTKFVLVALLGTVVPLALIGLWLTRTAERAGRQLLHEQLSREATTLVGRVEENWINRRSDLLLLFHNAEVQDALERGGTIAFDDSTVAMRFVRAAFPVLHDEIEYVVYREPAGRPVWSLRADAAGVPRITVIEDARLVLPAAPAVAVPLPLPDALGSFDAWIRLSALIPDPVEYPTRYGTALAVLDGRTGQVLLQTHFDADQSTQPELRSGRQPLLTVRRSLAEPPLVFVLTAPLAPFTRPFERAAQQGALAVLAVVLIACGAAMIGSHHLTRSLERLAMAADAVAHGDLDPLVTATGNDEVARLGRAFNVMTEGLRRTMRERSQRESLAAIGEFATALAHEIRNPLTAIRLDLQLVQEKIPGDSRGQIPLARALKEIERLNRTVNSGLKVARSGRIQLRPMDLREPLEVATHAAAPEFTARGARLESQDPSGDPIWVRGDVGALKQLFLNVLMNAAQALEQGGRAGTRIEIDEKRVTVSVWDEGHGIPPERLNQIWEPFFSTKEEGTGLGLALSQRIVAAHGGEIEIDTEADRGTTFRIRLPLDARRTVQAG
jgi:two-component system, NtrC family, sensor histidine kinase HydH